MPLLRLTLQYKPEKNVPEGDSLAKSGGTGIKATGTVPRATAGPRADDFLLARLITDFAHIGQAEKVSKTKVRRLFLADMVSLDGRVLRNPAYTLQAGSTLSAQIDPELFLRETDPGDIPVELSSEHILYEDEWIIAVNKPAGIPSEGTRLASRDHLHAALLRFLSRRETLGQPQPYAVPHHRLDRETSGVLLFSKSLDANPGLHRMFAEHQAHKIYTALCAPAFGQKIPVRFAPNSGETRFRVENRLARVSPKSQAARWGEPNPSSAQAPGDIAITDFHIVQRGLYGMEIRAEPLTGRTHQIRVHLSGLGLPIVGDELYGGVVRVGSYEVPRIMLHASSLSFTHPITLASVRVEAPLPADFRACLKAALIRP